MDIRAFGGAPAETDALFALIQREGEEWSDYWRGDGRARYEVALATSTVYVAWNRDALCGYLRCRDDDGFGVYIYDLLVDRDHRGHEYGRLLMERVCDDFADSPVFVLGDVYPYYEGLGYPVEGKVYRVSESRPPAAPTE